MQMLIQFKQKEQSNEYFLSIIRSAISNIHKKWTSERMPFWLREIRVLLMLFILVSPS